MPSQSKIIYYYSIPTWIKEELGEDGRIITSIKVVSYPDKKNTRSVSLCTIRNDYIEEVSSTPMHDCGLVTILDGKFVLIHCNGETTLHFPNARCEEDVIREVSALSEKTGLSKGITAYKTKVHMLTDYTKEFVK